ncbi:MAG: DUF899 family protein [Streptosporangiaceae bacterium]
MRNRGPAPAASWPRRPGSPAARCPGPSRSARRLFGGPDTLVLYSFMYGPLMEEACPMCTSLAGKLVIGHDPAP